MCDWKLLFMAALFVGCAAEEKSTGSDTETATGTDTGDPDSACGHRVDTETVVFGFNVVLDTTGTTQPPQGRPLQAGWTLAESAAEVTDHNSREYARITSYMMPIRDALMFLEWGLFGCCRFRGGPCPDGLVMVG